MSAPDVRQYGTRGGMAIHERVRELLRRYDEGVLTEAETLWLLVSGLTPDTIDAVVAAVPDGWRERFVQRLHELSGPEPAVWLSPEPPGFEEAVRPAIRAWVRTRGTGR
jgi:hypothetical protein